MPPQPLMIDGFPVQDDWSYAASSHPLASFDHANVDWQQLSEQPESAMSRSLLAGIACNQRHVGLAPQHWQHSMYQAVPAPVKPEPAVQRPKWVFGGLQPDNVAHAATPALPQHGAALLPPQQLAACQQAYVSAPALQHQPPPARTGGYSRSLTAPPEGRVPVRSVRSKKRQESQKRWVERQKVRVRDTQETLAQLEAEMQRMRLTRESLASRNAYLERQYSQRTSGSGSGDLVRDSGGSDPTQCPLLHAESAPAELQGQRRGSGFSAAECELHRASGGGGDGGGLAEMADMDEAAELEDAESRLDANGQPEAWWLTDSMQGQMARELQLDKELIFTVRPDAPLRLTRGQVPEMTPLEHGRLWYDFIVAFARQLLLISGGGAAGAAATQRLERLVFEASQLKGCTITTFPDQNKILPLLGFLPTAADPPDEVWSQIVTSARLSPLQQDTFVRLRAAHLANMRALAAHRKQRIADLQAAAPRRSSLDVEGSGSGGADLGTVTEGRQLSFINRLRLSIREEQSCQLQVILTMWRRVLTPVQFAHLNVAAWPAHTEILRIAEVVALAAGQPPSADILAQEDDGAGGVQPLDELLPPEMQRRRVPPVDLAALYPHLSPQQLGVSAVGGGVSATSGTTSSSGGASGGGGGAWDASGGTTSGGTMGGSK